MTSALPSVLNLATAGQLDLARPVASNRHDVYVRNGGTRGKWG